ncbi:hypothetical protein NQZ68_031135 [Dissostichus eleginoides]|nr:hypothetical protein NQZ68_031135 [Dissostichus eleginoides]
MERQEDPLLQFLQDRGTGEEILNKLKNDKRQAKRLEIGWMNFSEDDNAFKQVRTVKGGGTRHVCVDRQTKLGEIQEMAESLFFPNGLCKSLKLTDHVRRIRGFAQNEIDPDFTVEDLYEKNKVKLLRLYLCTKRNVQEANSFTDTSPGTPSEVIRNPSQDVKQSQASEPEVIIDLSSMSDADLINLLIPHAELLTYEESSNVEFISDNNEEGRRQDQGTLEMTTEIFRIEEEEDQGTGVSHALPEAHVAAMQRNTYTDDEVTFGPSFSHSVDLEDTLPWEGSKPKVIIVVRRGNCLADLLAAFIDPDMMNRDVHIKRKLPNGELEEGEGSGVLRDCLTEFWGEFYSKCTLGTNVKTPYLRHEYQVQEWQAIARILVTGWTKVRYFPLLSLPFLEECLYETNYSSVTESFLQYVSTQEREILELALKSFNSVEKDDLLDVLDAHDCHLLATEGNIAGLVSQLGHKSLIQTPMFVIDCWKPILKTLADTLYPQRIVEIVEERIPTPKRVKDLLEYPKEMTAPQNTVARHLRKYIGESDNTTLKAFLRFCTEADMLLGHSITAQFIETSTFQCRPQAHTCGCYLMLPVNYQNYPDLRNDFDLILRSSVWVMDII